MPAKRPSEQHMALANTPLKCELPDSMFSTNEVQKLRKYGTWLLGLADGVIEPETPAQKQFVKAARGEKDSTTEFERLFAKYRLYKKLCSGHDSQNAGRTPKSPQLAMKQAKAKMAKPSELQKSQQHNLSGRKKLAAVLPKKKHREQRDSLERPKKKIVPPEITPKKPEAARRPKQRTRSYDLYSKAFYQSPPPPPNEFSKGYGGSPQLENSKDEIQEFEQGYPKPGWIGSEEDWKRMRGGYRRDGN